MTMECTLAALARLDNADIIAVQEMFDLCLAALLAPELWAWMLGSSLFFVVIGGLIGRSRGRTWAGIVWSALLGPIGWLVVAAMAPVDRNAGTPPDPTA